MFLDTEPGMGIWTRHTTEDGRVFYYNMKRDRSKWESDFQHEMHTECTENKSMDNAVRAILSDNAVEWRWEYKIKHGMRIRPNSCIESGVGRDDDGYG